MPSNLLESITARIRNLLDVNKISSHQTWEIPAFTKSELEDRASAYCVCIPVINEGERIVKQLKQMKAFNIQAMADIIVADGGTTDGSLEESQLRFFGVRTLLVKTGPGKLSAQLRMGYSYALEEGYTGIITIDGNNKDNVEAIFSFINQLSAGYDFIQGSRYISGGAAINTPLLRALAVKLIHIPAISFLSGFKYTDTTNGFRGYSRKFLLDNRVKPFRNIFDTYELLAYLSVRAPRLGFKVIETPVTRSYPKGKKIPTKISGISGNLSLIKILIQLMMRTYNP